MQNPYLNYVEKQRFNRHITTIKKMFSYSFEQTFFLGGITTAVTIHLANQIRISIQFILRQISDIVYRTDKESTYPLDVKQHEKHFANIAAESNYVFIKHGIAGLLVTKENLWFISSNDLNIYRLNKTPTTAEKSPYFKLNEYFLRLYTKMGNQNTLNENFESILPNCLVHMILNDVKLLFEYSEDYHKRYGIIPYPEQLEDIKNISLFLIQCIHKNKPPNPTIFRKLVSGIHGLFSSSTPHPKSNSTTVLRQISSNRNLNEFKTILKNLSNSMDPNFDKYKNSLFFSPSQDLGEIDGNQEITSILKYPFRIQKFSLILKSVPQNQDQKNWSHTYSIKYTIS